MIQGKQVEFSLRPPTMDDIDAMVEFLNDWDEVHVGGRPYTKEDLQRRWTEPRFDLAADARVAVNTNGEIIGTTTIWDGIDPPVNPWLNLQIHPDWEDTNVGEALLAWGETRGKACFARVPEGVRVGLVSGAIHTHLAQKQLFEAHGYVEIRHFWEMEIELDKPPQKPHWPDGFEPFHYASKADVEANLEKIVLAMNDAFQDHFGYVERPLAERVAQWQHRIDDPKRFDPSLWYSAMDGDEIAAMSLCNKEDFGEPDKGHVNILGVRRPWRRRGLGLAILLHSFQEYYRMGKTAVTLGVDASSITNATDLYKKAGMHVIRQYDDYEKELRPGKDIIRRE